MFEESENLEHHTVTPEIKFHKSVKQVMQLEY